MADSKILFSEVQGFSQWWLWTIIYGVLGALFYATYQAYLESGTLFQTDTLTLALMSLLMPALFYSLKLHTRITSEGIYARFVPFHFKIIEISSRSAKASNKYRNSSSCK